MCTVLFIIFCQWTVLTNLSGLVEVNTSLLSVLHNVTENYRWYWYTSIHFFSMSALWTLSNLIKEHISLRSGVAALLTLPMTYEQSWYVQFLHLFLAIKPVSLNTCFLITVKYRIKTWFLPHTPGPCLKRGISKQSIRKLMHNQPCFILSQLKCLSSVVVLKQIHTLSKWLSLKTLQ